MNRKVIVLIVLIIAMFGIAYSIEKTARPPADRTGVTQTGGESHEGHDH